MPTRAFSLFKPYTYTKKETSLSYLRSRGLIVSTLSFKIKLLKVGISLCLVLTGVFILFTEVLVPVVTTYARTEEYTPVISPLPDENGARVVSDSSGEEAFTFKELSSGFMQGIDYVEEDGIVYPEFLEEKVRDREKVPNRFFVTIPKLEIYDAIVETNSTDLDPTEALGHYNGSCLPNEACNTFIFGHSTFRGSTNKYEDGDYTTVFSKLGELEYGDEFSITFGGEIYRYIVDLTKIERPENVNPLGEPLPKSLGKHTNTVELFTCTPPGTTKYRLSVVGKLVK